MARIVTVLILGLGLAAPASACLNDRESPTHEREFRSDYGDLDSNSRPAGWGGAMAFWGPIGGGGAMLLLAGLVSTKAIRRPKA